MRRWAISLERRDAAAGPLLYSAVMRRWTISLQRRDAALDQKKIERHHRQHRAGDRDSRRYAKIRNQPSQDQAAHWHPASKRDVIDAHHATSHLVAHQ